MTLVAAIFFVGLRRILSLSQTLALNYPIKKWAAGLAICGAIFYDIVTGSRVGTERALFMTLIMLGSVLLDRQALSMRNLGFAALLIILFEPEAIMGASFQLSFAAVAALVAVYEGRMAQKQRDRDYMFTLLAEESSPHFIWHRRLSALQAHLREGPLAILFATLCATSATASFMASDFHELSPYVLIGNPLTLTVIEVFAVPGAIIGTLLYPLGLDGPVWHYVGAGISFIMMMARFIASLPAATIHLPAFAPWSIIFFALAMLSVVLWRTTLLRVTSIPLAMIGLCGAMTGSSFDIAIPPAGDEIAIRGEDGTLSILGPRPNAFAAEQWLRADADGRQVGAARNQGHCDKLGCVARLKDGRPIALVLDRAAFAEDCNRANVIVTPLFAPIGCAAPLVIDRESLKSMGAVTLSLPKGSVLQKTAAGVASDDEDVTWLDDWQIQTARAEGEDRPWSQAPRLQWGQARGATKLRAKLSGVDAPKTSSAQSSQARQFEPEDEPPENEIDLQLQ
jgi:competence protein ComEC